MRNRALRTMIAAAALAPGVAGAATVSLSITIPSAAIAQVPRAGDAGTLATLAAPGAATGTAGAPFRTLDLPRGVSVRFNEQRVEMRCDAVPASAWPSAGAESGLVDASELNRQAPTPGSTAGECRAVATFVRL